MKQVNKLPASSYWVVYGNLSKVNWKLFVKCGISLTFYYKFSEHSMGVILLNSAMKTTTTTVENAQSLYSTKETLRNLQGTKQHKKQSTWNTW